MKQVAEPKTQMCIGDKHRDPRFATISLNDTGFEVAGYAWEPNRRGSSKWFKCSFDSIVEAHKCARLWWHEATKPCEHKNAKSED